jgi:hypothetical protein
MLINASIPVLSRFEGLQVRSPIRKPIGVLLGLISCFSRSSGRVITVASRGVGLGLIPAR